MSILHSFLMHFPSRMRAMYYSALCPIFFRKLGRNSRCHSGIKFGRPFSNVTIGRDAIVKHDVYFQTGKNSKIEIGDSVLINTGCHLVAVDGIEIGDNTSIAEYVSIRDQHHIHSFGVGVKGTGFISEPIKIGSAVWIGRGTYIGPGTVIGNNSIIGANSVVKGKFPPNVLIAGAPAKIKRELVDNESSSK